MVSRLRFQETVHSETDFETYPGEGLRSPPLIGPDTEPFSPIALGRPNISLNASLMPVVPEAVDEGVEAAVVAPGPSILIVDDNPINIKVSRVMRMGF